MPIKVIDLFAGPGGLGEGFSALQSPAKSRRFRICLSVEMDEFAHRTLELRAFFREFPVGKAPDDYYEYLRGALTRAELFARWPKQAAAAANEAWHAELGSSETPEALVDQRISAALDGASTWVLIGGPPCQAYSLVGRSRVIAGGTGQARYDADPRHHLYRHYLRILAVHRPKLFVMENVKGLLSAKVKNEPIFDRILSDLRDPLASVAGARRSGADTLEYKLWPLVETSEGLLAGAEANDFVIRAENFGVPQARHRIIILGVRGDVDQKPRPLKISGSASVKDAIDDLPRLRSGLSKAEDNAGAWCDAVQSIADAPWLRSKAVDAELRAAILAASNRVGKRLGRGGRFVATSTVPSLHRKWFLDRRLAGACNHESRGHILADLHRYFFAATFAKLKGRSPLLEDFPADLLPLHENVADALTTTKFNDRFRVQLRSRPSTTVVSHIAKDGHYYIHYDATQCRSLTVREAARLQTFPDNYFFEGPRTEQYKQVGNAVPPFLAHQIASIVSDLLADC